MINDEQLVKRLLQLLDNISTYKKGNTVYLSDGSSFELPEKTIINLNNSTKSYR